MHPLAPIRNHSRAPTLTHSPPPAAELERPSRDQAAAALDFNDLPRAWLSHKARLAILFPPGLVVRASPPVLALFGAEDCEGLEARLLRGEGPSARRLRRLAATLPIGEPRLEPMRLVVGRRPAGVNARCIRIGAPGGAAWLLVSIPALGLAGAEPPAADREPSRREDPAPHDPSGRPQPNSRFLWDLDEEGRFGVGHPTLAGAVGTNAPRSGESVEALIRRVGLDGDELMRALGEGRTFSGVTVAWPLSNVRRRRLVTLSAAPLFGRHREFLGYRGFGVLGGEIEAAGAPEGEFAAEQAEDARPVETAEFESPRPPTVCGLEAEVKTRGNAPDSIEASLELAPEDAPASVPEPEVSLDAEASRSAPAVPDASETGAPAAEPARPDLTERPATEQVERTAEIYVLRHPAPVAASNIVPIRPGALEALARETPLGSPAESVELSRSERDAFREIARALVGRAPASRDDSSDQRTGADGAWGLGIEPRADESVDRRGEPGPAPGADADEVQRNAGAILDRLPVGLLVVREGHALYANRTLIDLVGYRDFAEFQAANALMTMFGDRDPQAAPAEEASIGAIAIVRADGQILSVDGHAQAIGWDGAPATLIVLRRPAQAELRTRLGAAGGEAPAPNGLAHDLQVMLDRAADGAISLDSAGRILSLNAPAERLFGYHHKEVAGESLLMLLAPQSHPETTARLESLSRGGDAEAAFHPLQVVGRDRDGASIPLALTLMRIGPGEASGFCALARDLSRERETERRLVAARDAAEAASAAKTDFLAQVSHEIRTPLHAILGFAEVMLEERFGPIGNERYKDYLKDIHASGSHVMSLADDLLDLSKIEAGKLELAFAAVDANSVIRECVSLMQPQAARERVIMRVSLHDSLPRVMVDERSLKQIMLNLMSNAVKFNEPGGQVIVSTAVDSAGQAVIRVRDTGVGMNENEVGLALAPFSQVSKAAAKGGAGLGLPLTKALVEANKAEFSIKSRREQGTLIEIAFPNIRAAQ
jgi:PAS domain S-box-containing protein